MAAMVGVFVRCEEIHHKDCLKKLQSLMKPPETFVGAKKDDVHGGLKVLFKTDATVRSILREQYLLISGNRFSIHPLTTTLVIHTELFDVSEDFEEVLRNGIKHLGPVLTVTRLSLFEEFPDAYTGDWKVVLDVPEIEDLIMDGLSSNMTLNLPGYEKGFAVTFCCSYCEKDGHSLKICPETENVQDGAEFQTVTQSIRIDSVRSSNQEDTGQVPTSSRTEEKSGKVKPESESTVPTSSRLEETSRFVKSEMESTDEDELDSKMDIPIFPEADIRMPRRRKPTQSLQIIIPEGIKTIIRQNPGVLSEQRLEAFFNHVKKKSCPCMVANQYTPNIKGLKAQLQGIKDQYYNTPIIHSPEEKYFMKWFENVLTRFDRKPMIRSRNKFKN